MALKLELVLLVLLPPAISRNYLRIIKKCAGFFSKVLTIIAKNKKTPSQRLSLADIQDADRAYHFLNRPGNEYMYEYPDLT